MSRIAGIGGVTTDQKPPGCSQRDIRTAQIAEREHMENNDTC